MTFRIKMQTLKPRQILARPFAEPPRSTVASIASILGFQDAVHPPKADEDTQAWGGNGS